MAKKTKKLKKIDLDLSIEELAKKIRPTAAVPSNTRSQACSRRMSHNLDSAARPNHPLCSCCNGRPVFWTCGFDDRGDPLCITPGGQAKVFDADPRNDTRQFCRQAGCEWVAAVPEGESPAQARAAAGTTYDPLAAPSSSPSTYPIPYPSKK